MRKVVGAGCVWGGGCTRITEAAAGKGARRPHTRRPASLPTSRPPFHQRQATPPTRGVGDVNLAQDGVSVVGQHDAAVGVEQHLQHRARAQRGAHNVGHRLCACRVRVCVRVCEWWWLGVRRAQRGAAGRAHAAAAAAALGAAQRPLAPRDSRWAPRGVLKGCSPPRARPRAAAARTRRRTRLPTHLGRHDVAILRLLPRVTLGVCLQHRDRRLHHPGAAAEVMAPRRAAEPCQASLPCSLSASPVECGQLECGGGGRGAEWGRCRRDWL